MSIFAEGKKEDTKKIDKQIAELTDMARKILDMPEMVRYREKLNKTYRAVLKLIDEKVNDDPVKDAFFMRVTLAKVNTLANILGDIEDDVKKGEKNARFVAQENRPA